MHEVASGLISGRHAGSWMQLYLHSQRVCALTLHCGPENDSASLLMFVCSGDNRCAELNTGLELSMVFASWKSAS